MDKKKTEISLNLWKSKRNNASLILMEEGGDDTDNV